ncbi:MAG: triose-phosphate isomerase [Oscillospiraceae bacterium]|nr:triose-phosphate isomerase [Oscillospiraceae bacterium]
MNKSKRPVIIAGNWKMNHVNSPEFFERLAGVAIPGGVRLVVCAPATGIATAKLDAVKFKVDCAIGAQDVSAFESGAYTGEVSCEMLKHAGAAYVIIGHSERRQYHGESDVDVAKKLRIALESGLTPIVCVGETLEQRNLDMTRELVRMQVKGALTYLDADELTRTIIAYEPVWAIGTGETATPQDAQVVCAEIRGVLEEMFDRDTAESVSILYGGSMNDKNAADLLSQEDIDGGLIGGASLDAGKFAAIIKASE